MPTIAVVSDLHIGESARTDDLKPDQKNLFSDGFISSFTDLIKKENIKPDLLVIPGDLTDRAHPDQFNKATLVINALSKALSITPNKIIFAPGNHDMSWSVCKLDDGAKNPFWSNYRFAPLVNGADVFQQINNASLGAICEAPYFSIIQIDNMVILVCNSSAHDTPSNYPHHGDTLLATLNKIDEHLSLINDIHKMERIFVVHHHIFQYSAAIEGYPDFSIMPSAGSIIDLLRKWKFDIAIHGHKHVPAFLVLSTDMTHPLPILCAGSFGITLPSRYMGVVLNQFHLIEIDGRDTKTSFIYGRVRSWAYATTHGWIKSGRKHCGIDHIKLFGKYCDEATLEKQVRKIMGNSLKPGGVLEWREICKQVKSLSYLDYDIISSLLEKIKATDRAIDTSGDSSENLIIIRR